MTKAAAKRRKRTQAPETLVTYGQAMHMMDCAIRDGRGHCVHAIDQKRPMLRRARILPRGKMPGQVIVYPASEQCE
eukprot:2755450-Alexandrium_andersonii.AAC.1